MCTLEYFDTMCQQPMISGRREVSRRKQRKQDGTVYESMWSDEKPPYSTPLRRIYTKTDQTLNDYYKLRTVCLIGDRGALQFRFTILMHLITFQCLYINTI